MNATNGISARTDAVRRATGESPFLRQAILARPDLVEQFVSGGADAAIAEALAATGDDVGAMLRRRRLGLALTVALGDLAGELPLEQVTAYLSDFADAAIDTALAAAMRERMPEEVPRGIAVLALGKLGSRELNYSSDVDLILLFDPETMPRRPRDDPGEAAVRYGRRLVELLQARTAEGYVARVDLRLRPASEVTPIMIPIDAAIGYYESSALPWERAAFIRARACAGDLALGQRFLREIQPFIWRRALDFGAIDEIRDISLRIRDHYAQGQGFGPGFDLKRGRGGIREAEFFTQVQQLIHGGRDPALRVSATLDALAALGAAGHLDPDAACAIADAYRALRTIEHRVQMIDDRQEHRLPLNPAALDAVARLDGQRDGRALLASLGRKVEAVGHQFDGLVSERGERMSNDPDVLRGELAALGFEGEEAQRRIGEWRSGRARSLRSAAARGAFEAMLPTLLREVGSGPDPDRALNRFGDLVERLSSGVNFYRLLEARPALAGLVALILTHAPVLADQLARRPTLLDGLVDDSSFAAPLDARQLQDLFEREIADLAYDAALDRVRRLVGERRFALGVQLIAAHRDPIAIAGGYSALAEAAVVVLAHAAEGDFATRHGRVTGGELVILALGRLGGQALTHSSDLDLIYLFDAPEGAQSNGTKSLSATDYYNRLASRVTAALSVQTAAGPLYDVDTRLRPQGARGMLAVRVDAFLAYQADEAWTWEHMALCRARPLTGSSAMQAHVASGIRDVLGARDNPAKIRADAVKMRGEMARHKPPAGPLDVKRGPGGLIDLEFAIHTLQLTSGVGLNPRLGRAIADLAEAGLIDAGTDPDLRLLSRILVVLRLVASGRDMDPAEQSRALVAGLCGANSWSGLLAELSSARHRIAARWAQAGKGDG